MIDMKDLNIENPEDWTAVETSLRKMMQAMPHFYNDFYRLKKNLDVKIKELSEIDIKLRRAESDHYKRLRSEKLNEINTVTRTFSKMYLIASLAKR
jgi:archaellum component FlaC